MPEVAAIWGRVALDTSGVDSGLRDLKSGIQEATRAFDGISAAGAGIGTKLKGALSGITSGITGTLGNIGTGITTTLGAAGGAALKLAGDAGRLESMQDALQGMAQQYGFSVDALVANTKAASRNTLSEATIIQGALNALTLIGGEAFQELGGFESLFPKLAETAKKASRVTGQDAEFMFESIMLGIGRSSPMILDNLGITIKASDAQEEWAKEMGVSVKDLDAVGTKTATLNAFLKKTDEIYGNVAVTSGGFSGAMMKLKVVGSDLAGEIGMALLPAITPLLQAFTELVTKIGPPLLGAVKSLVGWFTNLPAPVRLVLAGFTGLATAVTGAGVAFGFLGPLLGPVLGIIGGLAAPLGLVIGAVALMAVAWQKNWGGIRESVTKAWGVIGPNLTNIASGIRIMAGAGKDLLTGKISFDTFLAQFGVAKTSIANSIGPILAVLGEAAGAIAAKLGEWARAFVDWIGPKIPDILAGLAGLIGSILGWIGEQTIKIAPAVLNWLAGFIEGLTQIVAGMGPAADGLGPNMVTTASRLFRGFIDWIGLELWPAVRPGLERLGAAIAEFLPTLATTIITGLVSALQALGGAIASALQSAINAAFANIHLPSINLGPISIGSGGGAAGGGESGAGAQTELGYYGLQAGGIVTRPTLAMVGEAGPEAILPLRGRGGMTRNATIVVQSTLPPNEFQLLQLARMLKPALEAA